MNSDGIYAGIGHLTPGMIREYLDGKLSEAKMHEIEMHLLDCDFCADAVEGFELSEKSHIKTERSLLALRKRLNERLRQHAQPRIIRWPAWSAAAGIALAIAGYVVIMQQEREQELLAIQQSEAFLQTGSNDTLLIFMPVEEELIVHEELIASGSPQESGPADSRPGKPEAAVTALSKVERKAIETPEAEVQQPSFVRVDSPDTRNRIAGLKSTERKIMIRGTGSVAKKLVTGRVVNDDEQPLPGVSIVIEGTTAGTFTDSNGNFKLEIPENKNTLLASMLGFEQEKISLSDSSSNILLAMRPNEQALEEVVVVGYGTQRRKALTGSVQIKESPLQALPENGTEAYNKYLADSLHYPKEALDKQIEGEVVVSFTVRPGGSVANFKILRSLGHGCDREAVRLIREGPRWNSTVVKGGRRHAAVVTQTVTFTLPR